MKEKAIEVHNLSFSYPQSPFVLKKASFSVYRGETFGIIGPNGAGKSTLCLLLNGVLKGEGQVRILGELITRNNLKSIRSKIGVVFQDPHDQLFMPSVFDDVAFGLLNAGLNGETVRRKVRSILKDLGLENLENRPPSTLSLGEMKKASLSTVLVLEPEIIVLDEPTASLDPGSRNNFIQILKRIDKTKIIATHDLDLVYRLCERVVLLDEGTLQAKGNASEILRNKDLLQAHNLDVPLALICDEWRRKTARQPWPS